MAYEFIKIEDSEIERLQFLDYGSRAHRDLMVTLLTRNSMNVNILDSAIFVEYHKRYVNSYYEKTREERSIYEKYVPEDVRKNVIQWHINFSNKCIVIEKA